MSLLTNRKRPRGFSESFDLSRKPATNEGIHNASNQLVKAFENLSSLSSSTFNESPNLNLNMNLSTSHDNCGPYDKNLYLAGDDNGNAILEEQEDDYYDENGDIFDNDVIFVEERRLKNPQRMRTYRNNSDLAVFLERDVLEAYNMFNVNNLPPTLSFEIHHNMGAKKQRTSSLPQLPQVKCFYQKLPNNYVHQQPKVGNIKTHVIPHKLNMPPCDDEDGHYIIRINDVFANRFVIQKLLGQGTFGKVVACYDKLNRETVAIKI